MTLPPGLSRLKDGRWRIRATAKDPRTGKIRDRQRTLPATTHREDALRQLLDMKEEIRTGERDQRHQQISLTDYATQWLEDRSARLRPTVVERDRWALERILPEVGDLYVDLLHRGDVRRFVGSLETLRKVNGDPYSSESVQTIWRVFRLLVADACRDLDVHRNPTDGIGAPRVRRSSSRERRTLTADELAALVEAARVEVPHRYGEILTLAVTGMRAGELFALRWQDIDFSGRRIFIRRSVHRGVFTATKTGDPREAALPDHLAAVLREHRPEGSEDTSLVFPSNVGTPRTPASLNKPLKA